MTIPWSIRPGFFWYFRLGRQWPYHSLTAWVRGIITDVLHRESDRKTPWSVRLRYGLWRPGAKRVRKKNPVWQTVVWSLRLKKPGLTDRGVAIGVTKFHMTSGGLSIIIFYQHSIQLSTKENGKKLVQILWKFRKI